MPVFKKILGWLLIALSLLVLVSSLSLLMRGSEETYPNLPSDQFMAIAAGRLTAILLPLIVGILLLRTKAAQSKSEETPTLGPWNSTKRAVADPVQDQNGPPSKGKSFVEMHRTANAARAKQIEETQRSGGETKDGWKLAADYFPDLLRYYKKLEAVDTATAEYFKQQRIERKDFSNAEAAYFESLTSLVNEACGSKKTRCGEFLWNSVERDDYSAARRFLHLARSLGAANMSDTVLERFQRTELNR